jgi:hypothetical protein
MYEKHLRAPEAKQISLLTLCLSFLKYREQTSIALERKNFQNKEPIKGKENKRNLNIKSGN